MDDRLGGLKCDCKNNINSNRPNCVHRGKLWDNLNSIGSTDQAGFMVSGGITSLHKFRVLEFLACFHLK